MLHDIDVRWLSATSRANPASGRRWSRKVSCPYLPTCRTHTARKTSKTAPKPSATCRLTLGRRRELSTMVQQGLAQALANMAKLEGDETMMNIAKAYCLLTASEDKFSMPETNTEVTSRQVMCAKQPQITPLLKIVSRTNETA